MFKVSFGTGIVLAAFLFASHVRGESPATRPGESPRIVNIICFIRGVEPRDEKLDLLEPVRQQIRLVHQHHLPATFLVQDDALRQERFVRLLKEELRPEDEVGGWLEVVQPQVEAAGLKWRGRFPWDWHTDVGFTIGYTPAERERLIDVFMADFQKAFGRHPQSVGCWILDAPTLQYLFDKYRVRAACVCKDQTGTDGYTLCGGYWNQAFYPSRLNGYMPAQTAPGQIPIPVFRMLGSDPIYQYDLNLGDGAQGVVSLEPVYTGKGGGGGEPRWVKWFFETTFTSPCLAFAYTQVGQENSFGWTAMEKGLTQQVELLAEWQKAGRLQVQTLETSGRWFRSRFPLTPATSVVATQDWKDEGRRAAWYNSRFYRVGFAWNRDSFLIRDLHLFDERYPERYLTSAVTSHAATYDALPVMDGFNWSTAARRAGIRLVNPGDKALPGIRPLAEPRVTQTGPEELTLEVTTGQGVFHISCKPDRLVVRRSAGDGRWALMFDWPSEKQVDVVAVSGDSIAYRHNNYAYSVELQGAHCSRTSDGRVLAPADSSEIAILLSHGRRAVDE